MLSPSIVTEMPVIDVNHDACILCDRCVRACDDIQGNDVIGRTGKPTLVPRVTGRVRRMQPVEARDVLETLRKAEVPMAFVLDEYGHFQGLVTPTDLTGAIVGDFRSDADPGDEAAAVERDDGSWLLAGWMPADEMAERLHITLPAERGYQTVAGLILDALKRVPQAGEVAQVHGWRFEVVDLDGRRIDKVLATPLRAAAVTHARRPGAGVTPGR